MNFDYYLPDVQSYSDYYPFGMLQPNRHGQENGANYRYNFQGQETDDEVKGKGNSVNYKYRMHDPRLGRFFAVDPLTAKYPHYTPYQFSGNKVIQFVELEGLEEATPEEQEEAKKYVNNFFKEDVKSAWSDVDSEVFRQDLLNLIDNPGSSQQLRNQCGTRASSYAINYINPMAFAKMATSLFSTGKYSNDGYSIETTDKIRNYKKPSNRNSVDFVVQTAMRNSENKFLDYDPNDLSSAASGYTDPEEIDDWVETLGGLTPTTKNDADVTIVLADMNTLRGKGAGAWHYVIINRYNENSHSNKSTFKYYDGYTGDEGNTIMITPTQYTLGVYATWYYKRNTKD